MVDLWSKCPVRKLWKIFKSISMQNFTFSEVSNYFSYFYSLLLIYSIGKIIMGRFLHDRPSSTPTSAPLRVRSWPAPSASSRRCQVGPGTSRTPHVSLTPSRAGNCYAPNPPPCPLLPKPIPFLCCDTVGHHRPNSHQRVIHQSPPRSTRMTACPPATLSYRVSCGAPWCPITTAHLRLLLAALPAGQILAMPRAKVLHPSLCELLSYPFSYRLTCEPLASCIATEASHHPAATVDRCQGHCSTTIPVPSTWRQGLMQCLYLLLPC
jgi:hypothetical protein